MANHEYKTLSEDAIKYLCGLIRDLASISEGIDNINLADDKTFSNIYIKNLINKCLEDANAEAEKLVGALTHLTCEETAIQPTLDNSEINVIYLYSANGNPPYQQFLKISEDKLVDLGSTSISLEDYIKAADVAKDYATKVELKAVTDKIGTTTLTTTDTTITGAIEEVKGSIKSLSTYSTEETKVGTWINGKPIYRKVFKVLKSELNVSTNTNNWSSPAFALSIDEIVDYDVLAFRNNGMAYKSVDYILNNSYSIAWTFSGFLIKIDSEIKIGSFMGDALYNDLSHIYGILYYTKS